MGAHWNQLTERIPVYTHKMSFGAKINKYSKISSHLLPYLSGPVLIVWFIEHSSAIYLTFSTAQVYNEQTTMGDGLFHTKIDFFFF